MSWEKSAAGSRGGTVVGKGVVALTITERRLLPAASLVALAATYMR